VPLPARRRPRPARLAAALLWGALAATATAHADPAQAQRHLQQGKRLYELGRFPEAIREFETSYKLSENPAVLYNLAQAHRRVGDAPRAIELYEAYLRHVPDAPNRAEIEERIEALRKTQAPPNQLLGPEPGASAAPPAGHPSAPTAPNEPLPTAPPPLPTQGTPSTPPVQLADAAPAPGERTHDGFFLRVLAGPGGLVAGPTGGEASASGAAGALFVALGGAVRENLVLYLEAGGLSVSRPRTNNRPLDFQSVASLSAGGAGAGLAYYVQPQNIYVSGSLLLAGFTVEERPFVGAKDTKESKTGLGAHLTVGKEWWVSRSWGLGFAGQLLLVSARMDRQDWASSGLSLLFSATYN
jgi:hypothetical protein